MRRAILPLLVLPLLAAGPTPRGGLSLAVPDSNSPLLPVTPPNPPPTPLARRFEAAPLPNRDVDAPLGPRASDQPSLSPSLVTRRDQFRGDGYSPGSTAQGEQERRLKPGAGFNLRVPLTGQ